MHRRQFISRLVAPAVGFSFATPVLAQDMGENGMAIPSFFFSGAEKRAREACENKEPSCRPDVKRQMSFEKQISLTFPWIGLAAGVLVILFYARKREQEKERKRRMAQARHVPGAHRKLDKDEDRTDFGDDKFG